MKQVGNYQVEDIPIGSGGMGEVLKGYGPDGTEVALKKIHPQFVSDFEYRSRIQAEIDFLRSLDHPSIVKVYDHFTLDGNLFIVMELIEGINLEDYVRKNGPMPWKDAIRMMRMLLDTMQYVHEHGIVHRDIKPGNVMVHPNKHITLLDFGVAKSLAPQQHSGTVMGSVIGTDGYMSPEQAEGMSIDHRSDIYALGCVFYFMLTGKHAFTMQGSEYEMQDSIRKGLFPKLTESVKDIPSSVQQVLDNAVDKNMMKRFQSCREFSNQLALLLPGGTQINTAMETDDIVVSVGRENCDICVGPDNYKVSRHHADIKRKEFTGGVFYVYTDCSSNGTVIEGQQYTRGMSYNIPQGTAPEILLAGDPGCRLNVQEVTRMLDSKAKEMSRREFSIGRTKKTSGGTASRGDALRRPAAEPTTFLGVIKTCFKKYGDFSGRASRSEYWYFVLANVVLNCLVFGICAALSLDPVTMLAVSGVVAAGMLLPSLAVFFRRMRDTGKTTGNIVLLLICSLIPVVGFFVGIYLLIQLCSKGQPETE